MDGGKETECPIRRNLHDRGACSLQVSPVVEIADQVSALDQASGASGNSSNAIWVDVTIRRYGRTDGGDRVEGPDERRIRGTSGTGRHCQDEQRHAYLNDFKRE